MTTLGSGQLPAGYDAWRTASPAYLEEPDVWSDVEFECEHCGQKWTADEATITDVVSHDRYAIEVECEDDCPTCDRPASARAGDEVDFEAIAADRYDRY